MAPITINAAGKIILYKLSAMKSGKTLYEKVIPRNNNITNGQTMNVNIL